MDKDDKSSNRFTWSYSDDYGPNHERISSKHIESYSSSVKFNKVMNIGYPLSRENDIWKW